jgi:Kdo2-lipid IVA lauroyltransferase/acyltransferase
MKFSAADYLLYYLAKGFSVFFKSIPAEWALFIGRRIGVLFILLNRKRYRIAYANLKSAFSNSYSPAGLKRILKNTYANIGQGVVDVFLLPKINNAYIEKYISFEDFDITKKVLSKGKGLIFLTAHFGTWEISHAALPYKGLTYKGIAREQKPYLLNSLLNEYRQSHGCKILMKGPAIKDALRTLRSNGIVGMLVDQDAGANGIFTDLFGRPASWHRGVIEIALKTGAAVVPGFAIRGKGPYVKFKVFEPLNLDKTLSPEDMAIDGMSQYARILESVVRQYPDQWLWQHRRWKSTTVRDIVILNDKKTGHLHQSEAIAGLLKDIWAGRGRSRDDIRINIIDVEFKNRIFRYLLSITSNFSGLFCHGCMNCLRLMLRADSYKPISKAYADIVISCGSLTGAVNLILSRENNARSIVIMKPSLVGLKHFNLAVVPEHDNPGHADNVLITQAALSSIDKKSSRHFADRLQAQLGPIDNGAIGVLIGGDTKNFKIKTKTIQDIIEAVIKISTEYKKEILVSTSRRTARETELYLKQRLSPEPSCRFLIIASEHNPVGAVEAILGISDIVLVSEDSVSMISEAALSRAYRIVFRQGDYSDKRHDRFLDNLKNSGYIETAASEDIYNSVKKALDLNLRQPVLDDSIKVKQALERLI